MRVPDPNPSSRRERRGARESARRRLRRTLLALLTALACCALAQEPGEPAAEPPPAAGGEIAAPFSALRILPAGRQTFDIASGETRLPDGGTVLTAEGGIRLDAPLIRYLEQRYLEADDGVLQGDFGTVSGSLVRFDLEAGTISVEGGVRLERPPLTVAASALRYDTGTLLLRLDGPVRGENPDFESTALLLDASDGTALLLGPYSYRDGLFTLEDARAESRLELRPSELDEAVVYDASSEVDPTTLDRFASLLP